MTCEVCGRTATKTFQPDPDYPPVLLCTLCVIQHVVAPRLEVLRERGELGW
jgi:hypothetical protein